MSKRNRNMALRKNTPGQSTMLIKEHKQTPKTAKDLANFSTKKIRKAVCTNVENVQITTDCLQQGYIVCNSESRLNFLYTFIKKNSCKKILVFFSSCASAKFHCEFFNYIGLQVMNIHSKQERGNRMSIFSKYCNANCGVLFCSEEIAKRLKFPTVDWLVQFDQYDDPKEYLNHLNKIAPGNALLILRPEELEYLNYLRQANISLNEYQFSKSKIVNIQPQLDLLISKNYFLHKSATDAFKGYVRAYTSNRLKKVFDVTTLDLRIVAVSFGVKVPPSVRLIAPTQRDGTNSKYRRKIQVKKVKNKIQ